MASDGINDARRKSASFLAVIGANAVGASPIECSDDEEANEEARTASLMYSSRMKYLSDSDQVKPNNLFMTRRQTQKALSREKDVPVVLKKLDVGPSAKKHQSNSSTVPLALGKRGRSSGEEKSQVWVKMFQAGCHFWQHAETGECRVQPPPGAQLVVPPNVPLPERAEEDDDDDEGILNLPDWVHQYLPKEKTT